MRHLQCQSRFATIDRNELALPHSSQVIWFPGAGLVIIASYVETSVRLIGGLTGLQRQILDTARVWFDALNSERKTIWLTGQGGGKMAALSDILIAVPDGRTNHIQEAHITIAHLIYAIAEERLCSPKL